MNELVDMTGELSADASSPEDIARSIVKETIRIGKSTKAQLISSALVREIAAMKKRGSGSKAS